MFRLFCYNIIIILFFSEDITNKFTAASDIEEYENIDLASISKSNLYKHQRNEHLNLVLNLMLSLVVASALGLGIEHFLGLFLPLFQI